MRLLSILSALLLAGAPAAAHEGEDHGDAPHPPAVSQAAPRFEAASEDFEIVGVLEGKTLTLYLDRRSTNEPVADAVIEIESGAFKGTATQVTPATYRLAVAIPPAPGRHPVTITVQSKDGADLLAGTIEIAPPAGATASPVRPWGRWAIQGAVATAAGAGLLALGLWWRSRRAKGGLA